MIHKHRRPLLSMLRSSNRSRRVFNRLCPGGMSRAPSRPQLARRVGPAGMDPDRGLHGRRWSRRALASRPLGKALGVACEEREAPRTSTQRSRLSFLESPICRVRLLDMGLGEWKEARRWTQWCRFLKTSLCQALLLEMDLEEGMRARRSQRQSKRCFQESLLRLSNEARGTSLDSS